MKAYEVAAIFVLAVLIIFLFHFVTAKGEKRRITLVNSEGAAVEMGIEVANDSATMAKGLMGRESLGEYEGMLFIFKHVDRHPFWMLNTTIPLDAIHIAENGTVVDVVEMEPCGLNIVKCRMYYAKAPAKYVLEANRGFSRKNHIVPGNSTLNINSISG